MKHHEQRGKHVNKAAYTYIYDVHMNVESKLFKSKWNSEKTRLSQQTKVNPCVLYVCMYVCMHTK